MKSLVELFTNKTSLQAGDRAPAMKAFNQNNAMIDLGDAYARSLVVIYFYLRAGTPVCTAHACQFRNGFARLQERDIQIFGVSGDSPERLQKFKEKRGLPFQLLSDPGGEIAFAFGVSSFLGFPARRAFLVRDGAIAWKGNASDALEIFNLLESSLP